MLSNEKATADAREHAASRLAFLERSGLPIELSMLAIGDLRVLHLPGEPMVDFQLFAQGGPPNSSSPLPAMATEGPDTSALREAYGQGG